MSLTYTRLKLGARYKLLEESGRRGFILLAGLMIIACTYESDGGKEVANVSTENLSKGGKMSDAQINLRKLTSAEIEKLLRGHSYSVSPGEASIPVVVSTTWFYTDGTIVKVINRVSKRGNWRVANDMICAKYNHEPDERCWPLFVSKEGEYYVIVTYGGDEFPVKISVK